jgi:beta-ribofuranosylaminobenzene 5'-phosphate synthase
MIRVQTASRLHFGLLSLVPPGTHWPDRTGTPTLPARHFGGVGLMVERPGIRLRADTAESWSAAGPLADRVLGFVRRFAESTRSFAASGTPLRLTVEEASPEHAGLGTGTQLAMAVGRCLSAARGLEMSAAEIARHVGRGERSALGVHGFEHGGFLVEGGHAASWKLSPLVARADFPAAWRIVLARPDGAPGAQGSDEQEAMARVSAPAATADALSRLVLLGMLPALAEEDLDAFGESLFDFNARAGEAFAPCQGGIYASPAAAELVAFIRASGVRGVGQSSWGPTVFAVVGGQDEAEELARMLRPRLGDARDVLVTRAARGGATIEADVGPSSPSGPGMR